MKTFKEGDYPFDSGSIIYVLFLIFFLYLNFSVVRADSFGPYFDSCCIGDGSNICQKYFPCKSVSVPFIKNICVLNNSFNKETIFALRNSCGVISPQINAAADNVSFANISFCGLRLVDCSGLTGQSNL